MKIKYIIPFEKIKTYSIYQDWSIFRGEIEALNFDDALRICRTKWGHTTFQIDKKRIKK
jgi:hypothetical protein